MKYEFFTDSIIYQMQQATAYCLEKGDQYLKAVNSGLTLDQFITLDVLANQEGICQMDLAKIILKDRVYTSRLVNVLEEKELIDRKLETKGKRLVKKLYLTDEGKNLHLEIKNDLEVSFNEVFSEVTDEELRSISQGIMKLKNCISKFTIMPL